MWSFLDVHRGLGELIITFMIQGSLAVVLVYPKVLVLTLKLQGPRYLYIPSSMHIGILAPFPFSWRGGGIRYGSDSDVGLPEKFQIDGKKWKRYQSRKFNEKRTPSKGHNLNSVSRG